MTIKLTKDYRTWKKGDIITPGGSLAERLVEQGKAVALKGSASQPQVTPHQPPASAASPQGEAFVEAVGENEKNEGKSESAGRKRQKVDSNSVQTASGNITEGG